MAPNFVAARFAAAAICATGLLAGCSTGSEPAPEQSTTSESPSGHGSFAECLTEHGVPAPPGPVAGPPPGVDAQQWQQAMESCSTLAPGPAGQ